MKRAISVILTISLLCAPNYDSFWFAGIPTQMGIADIGVDAVMEAQLHIIPNQVTGFAAKHS